MRWGELSVPLVNKGRRRKTFQYEGLPISAWQPGKPKMLKRWPAGEDFAVDVGRGWTPSFEEKFLLVEAFSDVHPVGGPGVVEALLRVLRDERCPLEVASRSRMDADTIATINGRSADWKTTLGLYQCIAWDEERKYGWASLSRGGGRFLPFHFARFVALGWATTSEVARHENSGLPLSGREGLGRLERENAAVVPPGLRWRMAPITPRHATRHEFRPQPHLWGT